MEIIHLPTQGHIWAEWQFEESNPINFQYGSYQKSASQRPCPHSKESMVSTTGLLCLCFYIVFLAFPFVSALPPVFVFLLILKLLLVTLTCTSSLTCSFTLCPLSLCLFSFYSVQHVFLSLTCLALLCWSCDFSSVPLLLLCNFEGII